MQNGQLNDTQSDRKWCETTPIRPIIASHLAMRSCPTTTFTISHFGSAQEPLCPLSSGPLVVINGLWYSYMCTKRPPRA
jgi:hypothetical protein